MARFRIDAPEIDVAALQRRVDEAIAAKQGTRFTAAELEEIRATPLRPRLRREDLPRGFVEQMGAVRRGLPQPGPAPAPEAVAASELQIESIAARPPVDIEGLLHSGSKAGVGGKVQRLMRSLFRRLTGIRLEPPLEELHRRIDASGDIERERSERAFDLLKENIDRRIDRVADWSGAHATELGGRLEERSERELHLLHNLIFELTNMKLDLHNMQDRINEMSRRAQNLEERERTLERMTLEKVPPPD
jgi:hypothetical protein